MPSLLLRECLFAGWVCKGRHLCPGDTNTYTGINILRVITHPECPRLCKVSRPCPEAKVVLQFLCGITLTLFPVTFRAHVFEYFFTLFNALCMSRGKKYSKTCALN